MHLNIMCIGDIVGKTGVRAVYSLLSELKKKYKIDYAIANCENANEGFGVNYEIIKNLFETEIDVLTSGNHIWHDTEDVKKILKANKRLLSPANYPVDFGNGYFIDTRKIKEIEYNICIINLQGRKRMYDIDCPFKKADIILKEIKSKNLKNTIIIVDMHADAVEEKEAMAYYLDGRVNLVYGTHTHVQTADYRISNNHTAYISDIGATAPTGGVIGYRYENSLQRVLTQIPVKNEVIDKPATLHGIILKVDENNLKSLEISIIKEESSF